MSIVELVKRTAVRRIVYVLVALVLGFVGIGRAEAATVPPPTCSSTGAAGTTHYCNRQLAYEACAISGANKQASGYGVWACAAKPDPPATATQYVCTTSNNGFQCSPYTFNFRQCAAPAVWNEATKKCSVPCDPEGAPLAGGYMKYTGADPGYQTCSSDCEYNNPNSNVFDGGEVDGIKYVSLKGWIPSGASCTVGPNDNYTPPADGDGDGKSDANDTSPNNPGSTGGGGEDESGKGQGSGPNGGQGNGAGEGSGNGNTSGGGGNCSSPPSSSGDAILGQIAYQAWATRCAIESAKDAAGNLKTSGTDSGAGTGTGTTPPVPGNGSCAEGAVNAAICAMKDGVKKITDFVDGLGSEATGLDDGKGEDVQASDAWAEEEEQPELDASGYGWGSTCPAPPQISIPGGGSLDWGFMCDMAQLFGLLILAAGYVQAAFIIGKA